MAEKYQIIIGVAQTKANTVIRTIRNMVKTVRSSKKTIRVILATAKKATLETTNISTTLKAWFHIPNHTKTVNWIQLSDIATDIIRRKTKNKYLSNFCCSI